MKDNNFYHFINKICKIKYLIILLSFFVFFLIIILLQGQFDITGCSTKSDNTPTLSNTEILRSLPYISWSPIKEEDKNKMGVTVYDPAMYYEGINFYNSRLGNSAYLMDMHGKIIHTWSTETGSWTAAIMDKNGYLFLIAQDDNELVKIDWDSNIVWKNKLRFHHHICLAENGDIYSLTKRRVKIMHKSRSIPILNDYITILSSNGKVKKEISILELFGKDLPERRLDKILNKNENELEIKLNPEEDSVIDVFHTNSVEIINRDMPGVCKKGDVLISIRELNLTAIISIKEQRVVWRWGRKFLDGQHNPVFLRNGNILIFDNGRYKRKYSRIIELNPLTKKIEWEYKAKPANSFYTYGSGACHELPNGNLLITESFRGRAFEITRDCKIVWEFYNPKVDKENKRECIIDMMRLSPYELKSIQKK